MPALSHSPAMCLQHSRSAAVSVAVGTRQTITTGATNSRSARACAPTLIRQFTIKRILSTPNSMQLPSLKLHNDESHLRNGRSSDPMDSSFGL